MPARSRPKANTSFCDYITFFSYLRERVTRPTSPLRELLRFEVAIRTFRPNFAVYFGVVAVGGVHPDFAVLAFSINSLNSCAVIAVRVLVLEKLPLARVIMLRASAA